MYTSMTWVLFPNVDKRLQMSDEGRDVEMQHLCYWNPSALLSVFKSKAFVAVAFEKKPRLSYCIDVGACLKFDVFGNHIGAKVLIICPLLGI